MKRMVLEFTDEDIEYGGMDAVKGSDYKLALMDMAEMIRANLKYGDKEMFAIDEINEEFIRLMEERGIILDDLY